MLEVESHQMFQMGLFFPNSQFRANINSCDKKDCELKLPQKIGQLTYLDLLVVLLEGDMAMMKVAVQPQNY